MDHQAYQNNMKIIGERFPEFVEEIKKYKESFACGHVFWEKSQMGEGIPAVLYENRNWYFNSRYEALESAKIWADQFRDINKNGIFILCGLANGMYADRLLEKLDEKNILIIYEPDPQIYMRLLQEKDISRLLSDERVYIFAEEINMRFFRDYADEIFEYEKINITKIVILPNYDKVYTSKIAAFVDMCEKTAHFLEVEINSRKEQGKEINDNCIDNIWYSIFSSSIDELAKQMKDAINKNIPAIIVSAGPSLDKNIEELKNAKNKAFIIAVDSALRMMAKYKIMPDLTISVDSYKPMELFRDEEIVNIPMVVTMQTRTEVMKRHKGKKIMFANSHYILEIYKLFGKQLSVLKTGGSVANNAFSLVKFLGFKRIILIGQDLAFTDNKKHASMVYKESAIGEDSEKYTEIEGIDGKPMLTYHNFKLYRDWFEAEIKDNPKLHVINATEGGAVIRGAENKTLKETIEKYCNKEISYESILAKVPDSFSNSEKIKYFEVFQGLIEKSEQLERKLETGIRNYHKLESLMRAGKTHTNEFQRVKNAVEEINSVNKKDILMEFVSMYAQEEEFEILNDVYYAQKGAESEASVIIQKGTALLRAYIKANRMTADRIRSALKNIAEPEVINALKNNG